MTDSGQQQRNTEISRASPVEPVKAGDRCSFADSEISSIVKESFKIVIIGESGVGKSSLLSQFIYGNFSDAFVSTIGIDFGSKTITIYEEAECVKYHILLKIFDSAGQKRFRTISEHYQTTKIDGTVVLIDITSVISFETASEFISRARELAGIGEYLPIVLIGNKLDLVKKRCVSREKIEELAREYNVEYREISVKESLEECEGVFELITRKIIESHRIRDEDVVVNIDKENKPRRRSMMDRVLDKVLLCRC